MISNSFGRLRRPSPDICTTDSASTPTPLKMLLSQQGRTIDVAFTKVPAPGHEAADAAEAGSLGEVVAYFRRLRPTRLVIGGEAGAGSRKRSFPGARSRTVGGGGPDRGFTVTTRSHSKVEPGMFWELFVTAM